MCNQHAIKDVTINTTSFVCDVIIVAIGTPLSATEMDKKSTFLLRFVRVINKILNSLLCITIFIKLVNILVCNSLSLVAYQIYTLRLIKMVIHSSSVSIL